MHGQRRHQNRPQPGTPGDFHGLAQLHPVAPPQNVGVVHQQDRVADDDPCQHYDAEIGLKVERGVRQIQRQHDADRRRRHREHDDERVAERLVLRRHDGVDEDKRQNQHQAQLVERLRLLLDLGSEADRRTPAGATDLRQTLVDRGHRLAQRNLGLGADLNDALLVLAIDLAGPELRLNRHDVLDGQRDAAAGVDHHVVDVAHLFAILKTQANDDGIFVSALPELRGRRSGHVGPDRLSDRAWY